MGKSGGTIMNIQKIRFSSLDINDSFFDSFKFDYPDFTDWFKRKENDFAYVLIENGHIEAFLYLKVEENEVHHDIIPLFSTKPKLKIGSFKVKKEGFGIGKRFIEKVFSEAKKAKAEEIYVTLFNHDQGQLKFISFIEKHGFTFHGHKNNELVFVKKNKIEI